MKLLLAFFSLLLAFFGIVEPSLADVPAGVTTAITTATTDVATIGGAVLVVVITIASFMWLRRPMH